MFAHTSVCVQVVPEQGDGPEGPPTQVTFVRPLIRVAFHVSVQIGASRTRVAAQLALKRLLHSWETKAQSVRGRSTGPQSCSRTPDGLSREGLDLEQSGKRPIKSDLRSPS